jgi:hypothetical protein
MHTDPEKYQALYVVFVVAALIHFHQFRGGKGGFLPKFRINQRVKTRPPLVIVAVD